MAFSQRNLSNDALEMYCIATFILRPLSMIAKNRVLKEKDMQNQGNVVEAEGRPKITDLGSKMHFQMATSGVMSSKTRLAFLEFCALKWRRKNCSWAFML